MCSQPTEKSKIRSAERRGFMYGICCAIIIFVPLIVVQQFPLDRIKEKVSAITSKDNNPNALSKAPQDSIKNNISSLSSSLQIANSRPPEGTSLSKEKLKDRATKITVKVQSGSAQGSGILIDKQGSIYTVVTNAHVIKEGAKHAVMTFDNKQHEAKLLVRFDEQAGDDDLAVLQFDSPHGEYEVAELRRASTLNPTEKVVAAGFPGTKEQFALKYGDFSIRLPQALKGGYQIGYLIDVEKGMSGGPLLDDWGQVVGINGKHQPLWSNSYDYEDGSQPSQPVEELDQYSWAIPIEALGQQWANLPVLPSRRTAVGTSTPQACPSPKRPAASPVIQKSEAQKLEAKLFYKEENSLLSEMRLEFFWDGKKLHDKPLRTESGEKIGDLKHQIIDLDGDGEDEVIVDVLTTGDTSYSYSLIYGYEPTKKEYVFKTKIPWGSVDCHHQYQLEDLDGDGIPEFKSYDDFLVKKFSLDLEDSGFPIQIWRYEGGNILDVTRKKPDIVENHTKQLWEAYENRKSQNREVKGVLAAYLAEKYLLGKKDDGWQKVKEAYKAEDSQEYFEKLKEFIQQAGYDK